MISGTDFANKRFGSLLTTFMGLGDDLELLMVGRVGVSGSSMLD